MLKVLLVEDSPMDAMMLKRYFQLATDYCQLSITGNGEEALSFMEERRKNPWLLPDLIITDLNMPRINGHELLQKIKTDSDFSDIPVVILSTSNTKGDVKEAYRNRASSYLIKPGNPLEFQELVGSLWNYWSRNHLLNKEDGGWPLR